jgi:hypothetical protein
MRVEFTAGSSLTSTCALNVCMARVLCSVPDYSSSDESEVGELAFTSILP